MSQEDNNNNNKHHKMTLLSFEETMKWVNSPQAEGRIGHEDGVLDIFKEMIRENRDNKIGDGGKQSPFMIRLG